MPFRPCDRKLKSPITIQHPTTSQCRHAQLSHTADLLMEVPSSSTSESVFYVNVFSFCPSRNPPIDYQNVPDAALHARITSIETASLSSRRPVFIATSARKQSSIIRSSLLCVKRFDCRISLLAKKELFVRPLFIKSAALVHDPAPAAIAHIGAPTSSEWAMARKHGIQHLKRSIHLAISDRIRKIKYFPLCPHGISSQCLST